jgi:hypothetical protein
MANAIKLGILVSTVGLMVSVLGWSCSCMVGKPDVMYAIGALLDGLGICLWWGADKE